MASDNFQHHVAPSIQQLHSPRQRTSYTPQEISMNQASIGDPAAAHPERGGCPDLPVPPVMGLQVCLLRGINLPCLWPPQKGWELPDRAEDGSPTGDWVNVVELYEKGCLGV
jgi:hypothetical protein